MAAILVVDDQGDQRKVLANILTDSGHVVDEAGTVDEALEVCSSVNPDVVVTDLKMAGKSGMVLVETLCRNPSGPEIIMVTAFATIDTAIKAVKAGAYDYLSKPVKPEELLLHLEKAVEKRRLRLESQRLRRQLLKEGASNLVAESTAMRALLAAVDRVAPSESTVLIRGETGSGKECVARLIHLKSRRAERTFQAINCAAVTETLLDSELFGHEKGAFTGAVQRKMGIFESASDGTLFLDEIGDMSLGTQARILRALQERKIRRVGGTEDIPVNVRLLAATNKNLEEAIRNGAFREDLFYRLNVVPLTVPPLRERKADIQGLAERFLARFSPGKSLTAEVIDKLSNYGWPGNVRELEAAIERMAVFSTDSRLTLKELPQEIAGARPPQNDSAWTIPDTGIVFEDVEREMLSQALAKSNGNMVQAAKLLGMNYRAFRYRVNGFGLKT